MESILKAQQGWYRDVWGLEHIPFYDFPPEDQVAQRRQYKTVGAEEFEECYKELQGDISIQVPPEVKRILYFAFQRGGIPITKDAPLDDLMTAVGVSTLTELVPYLNTLVRADLLTRDDRTGLPIYKLSPGAEQAAQEGAPPKGGI